MKAMFIGMAITGVLIIAYGITVHYDNEVLTGVYIGMVCALAGFHTAQSYFGEPK